MTRGWSKLIAAVTSPGRLSWPTDQRPWWVKALQWTGSVALWLFVAVNVLLFAGFVMVMAAGMKAMVQFLRKTKF